MELAYKKTKQTSLNENSKKTSLRRVSRGKKKENLLIEGDNLKALGGLSTLPNIQGQVDLIYIDPPFATNRVFWYNSKRTATISFRNNGALAYQDLLVGGEYLDFLRVRLEAMKELLSDKGSIYVHIDYKIGHYVKVLMDEIFGQENFRNDITRIKCNPKNFSRNGYGNVKDMILFYTKTPEFIWNEEFDPFNEKDIATLYQRIDAHGRRYTTTPIHAPGVTVNGDTGKVWKGMPPPEGRHWRYSRSKLSELDKDGRIHWSDTGNPRLIIYADERQGKRAQDIWEYKDPQYPEYPTEKNFNMLKRIVRASSNKTSLVMDAFCGSGTTLLAAAELARRWIGIDDSKIAISTTKKRLDKAEVKLNNKVFDLYKIA